MIKHSIVIIFALLLTGCTSKDLYNAGLNYQKSKCMNEAASEQQYNDCVTTEPQSYDEYQQERTEALEDAKSKQKKKTKDSN